jgi:hypothetical protein
MLKAITLLLCLGAVVEGFRDQTTKKQPRELRGLQESCSIDFTKAITDNSEITFYLEALQRDGKAYVKIYVRNRYSTQPVHQFLGLYYGWCVDHARDINVWNWYSGDVMSAYDGRLQPGGRFENAVDKPQNLPNLAWLINNINVGDQWNGDNCNYVITKQDLQNAVWDVIDDANGYETADGTPITSGWNVPDHVCVAKQVAALALEKGNDYQLDCSDPNEQIPILFIVDDSESNIQKQVMLGEYYLTDIEGLVVSD